MNERDRFLEDMGQHMVGWGVARTTGRIYAYLLLQTEPVGLDQLTRDLGIAKSAASVGTRQLLMFGMARAVGARGSRRLMYEAILGMEAIVAARDGQVRDLVARLHQGAAVAAPGAGRERLAEMAAMMEEVRVEMAEALRRVREKRGNGRL